MRFFTDYFHLRILKTQEEVDEVNSWEEKLNDGLKPSDFKWKLGDTCYLSKVKDVEEV